MVHWQGSGTAGHQDGAGDAVVDDEVEAVAGWEGVEVAADGEEVEAAFLLFLGPRGTPLSERVLRGGLGAGAGMGASGAALALGALTSSSRNWIMSG